MLATVLVTIPSVWLPLIAAVAIPVLTAVVTRYRTSTRLPQALVAFLASGVLAGVALVIDDTPGDTLTSLTIAFLMTFLPQLAAYIGFWQPVVNINERLAPDKGI